MIVKKMENPVYHRKNRNSLPGKDFDEAAINQEKSFEQYLVEAFKGEVVQRGHLFSTRVSPLAKDNLIHLNQSKA